MSTQGAWKEERGFTLAEVLITITIMGIVFAIASSTWFRVIDSRRVDSATNQVVADLRLAHSQATNRLIDSNFIVAANGSTYQIGPAVSLETRSLYTSASQGNEGVAEAEIVDATTVMFKADGSAQSAQAVDGKVSITVRSVRDSSMPPHTIEIITATSRIIIAN